VSLALMIAGSLLVRSANHALTMRTGYDGERVINLRLTFPEEGRYTTDHQIALVRDLRTRIAALPGVTAVTIARAPDDAGGRRAAVSLDGQHPSARNTRAVLYYTWVQPNFFETLGVSLIAGRAMPMPSGEPEPSIILSESAARRLWPGQNPIGRSLRLGTDGQFHSKGELLPDGKTWQVIGVARDTRGVTIDNSDAAQVYLPLPADRMQDYPLLVRTTAADPAPVMRAIEPLLAAADPNVLASMSTLQEMLHRTDAFLIASVSAAIASTISLFGLFLAAMGIYSTVSYLVVLRTHEVGIRMAIGAKPRDILLLMLHESARPVLAGLCAGIALAAAASQLLRGALYGLTTIDLTSFAAASAFFLLIAAVATLLPSRRALRIDPLVALRYE
jgi:MacB-like periplasmic core domain/FtsX-like permease family